METNKMQIEPGYKVGDKVLVEVLPNPTHRKRAWLPGTIEKALGTIDLYDGKISQAKVNFPVVQHHYWVGLDEGGGVMNAEQRITSHPHGSH
jgi:hypothetical protein